MFSFVLAFIVLVSIYFVIRTLITVVLIDDGKLNKAPKLYIALNSVCDALPLVRDFSRFLKKSYFLMFQNKLKGEIMAVSTIAMYPVVSTLCFVFLSTFSNVWYLLLLNLIICFVFTLLFIKTIVINGTLKIQNEMVKVYLSLGILLSKSKMEDAITEVIRGSSGKPKIIMERFKELYLTDRTAAYDYLVSTVGDNYTESVVYNLIQLEEYGTSPTEDITRTCRYALDMAQILQIRKNKFNGLKLGCVGVGFINIALHKFSNQIVHNLGYSISKDSTILYGTVLVCFICLLAIFLFESN